MKKIGIFIDGVTMFHGLQQKPIHFGEFKEWLQQEDEVTTAHYFNCVNNKETKKMFFSHVYKSGYILHIKDLLYNMIEDRYILHGVDTELTIQAIHYKDKYDKIIIVSGKHDFIPLCEYLTLQGKEVEVVGFKKSIHKLYNKYPKKYIEDFLQKK